MVGKGVGGESSEGQVGPRSKGKVEDQTQFCKYL